VRIKVGDLVKFKHHMFDGLMPVHLVCEVFVRDTYDGSVNIRLHGNSGITHRANNFVVISRGKKS
tara:strand:- start:312 stop:506 length:195 start_codon:yes stop_codon:yes gene_type:complete